MSDPTPGNAPGYDPSQLSEHLFQVDTILQAQPIEVAATDNPKDETTIPGTRFAAQIGSWLTWYLTPIAFQEFADQFTEKC